MKTTAIISIAAAAIGFMAGSQLPRGIVSGPVSITTFKIKVPFDQWSSGFDSKEARKMHKNNKIKPLFRGVNINNSSQVVVIHQSEPGSVEQLLSNNRKMIESSGHIYRSTKTSNWLFQ